MSKLKRIRQQMVKFLRAPWPQKLSILWNATLLTCNSMKRIFIVFIALAVLAIAMFAFVEEQTLIDSVYWMATTSSTTGYGDLSPKKPLGKVLTSALMIAWYVLGAIFLANLVANVLHDPDAWTHDEQQEVKANARLSVAIALVTHANVMTSFTATRSVPKYDMFMPPYLDGNLNVVWPEGFPAELIEQATRHNQVHA